MQNEPNYRLKLNMFAFEAAQPIATLIVIVLSMVTFDAPTIWVVLSIPIWAIVFNFSFATMGTTLYKLGCQPSESHQVKVYTKDGRLVMSIPGWASLACAGIGFLPLLLISVPGTAMAAAGFTVINVVIPKLAR